MKAPPASTREFARRLLALEAGRESTTESNEALRVCEKLRISLTRFAGPDGFTSLLQRALARARADFPALEAVKVGTGGHLEGFEEFFDDASKNGTDAAVEIIAWLLALLGTFIGESLTRGLVRDVWPELPQEESQKIEAL